MPSLSMGIKEIAHIPACHVKIHTDHKALQFLSTCVQNNPRIARWFNFLKEFNLEIIHIPGKKNNIADTLSRNNGESEENSERDAKRIAIIRDHQDGVETTMDTMDQRRTRERPGFLKNHRRI